MKMFRSIASVVVLVIVFAGFVAGCRYSTRPNLEAHQRSVWVKPFINITEYRRLEVDVTDAIIEAFKHEGNLPVNHKDTADLIVSGTVESYSKSVSRETSDDDVVEGRILIRARFSIFDVKKDEFIIEDYVIANSNTDYDSGSYYITAGESELDGRVDAVEDLGLALVRFLTERW